MKLLYVIGSMEVGGAEQHLLRVSTALRERGFHPEVFAITTGGPLTNAFIEGGVPVHGVKLPGWIDRILSNERAIAWAGLLYSTVALLWLYWRKRPQVVHFFLPSAYIVGGVASIFGPKMLRIMSRRSLNLYQAKHRLFRRVEHWLHPHMDLVCGNSRPVLNDLLAEGVKHEKIRLIYNGVNLEHFAHLRGSLAMRAELSISDDALVFVIVANLIPYKGHSDLIEAFGKIQQHLPYGWVCLCVGRDDGIEASLRNLAATLGIEDHIQFLGSRADVPELLNAADIGVLCSHEEGFSNAVLEGMAARLPMVVTDVGGNAEAVLHGTTGIVVAPHAPAQLADALLAVAYSPDRAQMGAAGRERLEAMFSMDACLQAYTDLYRGSANNGVLPKNNF
ncbi:glycosyltransferase [Pseudomonas quasicaspiana]|uniref:glycosyltransferase n=1 Tax=Pseudomonas quasicaspiana TaxID=2829821 RepID=UPI001E35795D|nr:glycosyltransferase [Pseudomonas quasicaspiana]MCD5971707.1 glycosyltransferase [Pseudomonas quasicaspiana]